MIGPDGKEIPIVLVVKHLVGKFKSKDLNKLPFKKMTTKPVVSEKGTVKLAVKKSEVAKAASASKPTKKISIAYKFYSPTPLKASKYIPVKVEEKKNNTAKDSGKKAETETPAVSSKTDLKPKNTPKVEDGTLKKDIEVIKPKFVESGTKALEDKKIVKNIKNEKEESILKPDVEEVNNFADLTKGEWE